MSQDPPQNPPPYGGSPDPYSQPPYQPGTPAPSYGPGPGGPGTYGVEHPQGTLILVLGILSIVICGLTGPFAAVMGRRAMKQIDASGQTYTNRGQVQAGFVTGIIGTVFLGVAILYIVFLGVLLVVAAGTATTG